MKLFWKIFLVAVLLIITVAGVRFFSGPEDAWLCRNGEWVKHGQPRASKPTAACGSQQKPAEILVTKPQPNQVIKSLLIVEGQAVGNWFFEASFPIKLIDDQGKILGQSYVQARSDWMTEDLVPFRGEISYQTAATTTGKLILTNDNPSGLPQNEKSFTISVVLSPSL